MRIQPIWLSLVLASPVLAQGAPAGYYNTVDTSSPLALRQSLHAVIDDHLKLPYTGGSVDTWDVLRAAQEDPANSNNILDIYKNASYVMGSTDYNREHSWPKSFGFPNDGPDNYPYTDCHMLFLADAGYNTARSNRPFRLCSASCTEYPTVGGASGSYPSDSNWGSGSFCRHLASLVGAQGRHGPGAALRRRALRRGHPRSDGRGRAGPDPDQLPGA
ncbi:MAG: endonuclease [Planctomycetota bacterium]